ncbi:MAG: phospholipase [Planctomycetaceae bacterium]|nr:phospholipase [Planctomycetaceae bacterium]
MKPLHVSLLTTALLLSSGYDQTAPAADDKPAAEETKDIAKARFERRVFENAEGKKLNYRLLTPVDLDKSDDKASKKYPLVLFLHGAGERGDDNEVQLIHGMNDFANDVNRAKFPCFVVAPQCPQDSAWASFRRPAGAGPAEPSSPLQLTIELLESLAREFPAIDSRRLYVTGLSMGGFGTWDLIARLPEKFAAAAPICGGGDEQQASKVARIPLWVFHGDQDGAVKVDLSRNMVAAIKKAGGRPLYTEYVGVGHDSWTATYKDPLFMTWLFAQERPE